jgi:type IV pilus assembly protein PilE
MKRTVAGFSLIELLTVVTIIGILSAIAYPSYTNYVKKGKRAEGRGALLAAAQRQERFMTNNNTYTTNLAAAGIPAFSGQSAGNASAYTITVVAGAAGIATSFIVKATPSNFIDPECNILTYDQAGTKNMESATETNVSKCWQ